MSDIEYYWHEAAGARIRLPSTVAVRNPFPEFFAEDRKDNFLLDIEISSNADVRESVERNLDPPCFPEISVIHDRLLTHPCEGREVVIEERMPGPANVFCSVICILYMDKKSGAFADIQVHWKGVFGDMEHVWSSILDSFSWNKDVVVLRYDGDELAYQAPKKQKKRSKKQSIPGLPASLRYLEDVIAELSSMAPEDVNEGVDTTQLHEALTQRVQELSLGAAEKRLTGDRAKLQKWIDEDPQGRHFGEFIRAFMLGFEFHLGEM